MIYEWGTQGQWIVIWFIVYLLSAIGWEVLLAIHLPWDFRGEGDPPPIAGGLAISLLSTLVAAGVLGLVHGLTWMWLYG